MRVNAQAGQCSQEVVSSLLVETAAAIDLALNSETDHALQCGLIESLQNVRIVRPLQCL